MRIFPRRWKRTMQTPGTERKTVNPSGVNRKKATSFLPMDAKWRLYGRVVSFLLSFWFIFRLEMKPELLKHFGRECWRVLLKKRRTKYISPYEWFYVNEIETAAFYNRVYLPPCKKLSRKCQKQERDINVEKHAISLHASYYTRIYKYSKKHH